MKRILAALFLSSIFVIFSRISPGQNIQYTMPEETALHEGTWIQWPHNFLYGPWYRVDVEPTFISMTNALQSGEKVHIIAYNNAELSHIIAALNNAGVPLTNIDFFVHPTDDVWSRDNGPMFVFDTSQNLTILDWGFNGWGFDTPYSNCDVIPQSVSTDIGIPRIDLNAMVLEGGAIEHDGNGTMMATRSSITHPSRNPALTESQIESYLTTYMGITHFIWLDGVYGQDITDMHIDGFVKFANDSTIVTMNVTDLAYWYVSTSDINTIYNATDAHGNAYNIVTVPLSQNDVVTTHGNNLGYKGSYCNYYIANNVVLVPTYNDPNDAVALSIIQGIYPNRSVIGIDVRNLYEYGGMIHCITQQQPAAMNCLGAANLSVGNITQNSARLEWIPSANAHHYSIRGGRVGNTGITTITVNGGNTAFKQVYGLGAGNTYWWQIRTHCNAGETLSSGWSETDTFSVLTASCATPSTHWTSNITNTSATLNWTHVPGSQGYMVSGAVAGTPFSQWVTITVTPGSVTSKTVNNLTPGQTYEWQIATGCNVNPLQLSPWSASDFFTINNSYHKLGTGDNFLITKNEATDFNPIHYQSAWLSQNFPNPVSAMSVINYYLPEKAETGELIIVNLLGKELKKITLSAGSGQVIVDPQRWKLSPYSCNELSSAILYYSLVIDGETVVTKKMGVTE